jgi:Ras-related GTP-binding protein A/B
VEGAFNLLLEAIFLLGVADFCNRQDAFMDSYVSTQRSNIFSDVAVLIYVFDIESREVNRDLDTYSTVIRALHQYSPSAYVFCLIHKMDLIQHEHREHLYLERAQLVKDRSDGFDLETFASTIWDESIYKAWAGIVHKLIPNLSVIERFLHAFAKAIKAEEIVLFERSTFLTVTSVVNKTKPPPKSKAPVSYSPPSDSPPTNEILPDDDGNPNFDRHERISNILKTYKHTIARNTSNTPASAGFILLKLQTAQFNLFLARFTDNTYVLVVVPPGEAAFNCAVLNTLLARESFEGFGNGE